MIVNLLTPYDTIALSNTALLSYLPLSGGTMTSILTFNSSSALYLTNSTYIFGQGLATGCQQLRRLAVDFQHQ